MLGLIVGDGGLVSVNCHRKGYLVSPSGFRQSTLEGNDPMIIDANWISLNGQTNLDACGWQPHRLVCEVESVGNTSQQSTLIFARITGHHHVHGTKAHAS